MLSVIVPVYNSIKYLEKCITSICKQNYQDLEIICIDDGSRDGSGELLDSLSCNDSRIKVFHQDNSGVSIARNRGLQLATGEYVTFVDSDDEIHEDMYEVLMNYFKEQDVDIVHCGYKKKHLDGTETNISGTYKLMKQSSDEAIKCLIEGRYFTGGTWNKIFSKSCLEGISFETDLKINEDILFTFCAFQKARNILFYDAPFYSYYEREGSACFTTADMKKAYDCSVVAEKMCVVSRGKSYYENAISRYYSIITNEYRCMLMVKDSKNERLLLKKKIYEIQKLSERLPFKHKINNAVMLSFPVLYLFLYEIYNKLRKPNWDVKE